MLRLVEISRDKFKFEGYACTSVMELLKFMRKLGSALLTTHSVITGRRSLSLVFLSISCPILASISMTAPIPGAPPAGPKPTSSRLTTSTNKKSIITLVTSSDGIMFSMLGSHSPDGPWSAGGGWGLGSEFVFAKVGPEARLPLDSLLTGSLLAGGVVFS